MVIYPNCKINLGLHITARCDDGFHDIETLFYPVPLYDILEMIPAPDGQFRFTSSGLHIPGEPAGNLCVKAFRLVQEWYGFPPVHLHLHKIIPMGSGLGGGSADAAFTLRLALKLFDFVEDPEELRVLARNLGSDCAFFLENTPVFATGRGDRFEPVSISLAGLTLLIVFPGIHVSTAEAYRMTLPRAPEHDLRAIALRPVEEWRGMMVNDFQKPVSGRYPEISTVIEALYREGAVYASLSGSGSAVFGLFRELPPSGSLFPRHYSVWSCIL